ncbi:60S ribosomal protein L12-B [Lucilia cuprina]|nr:60S ribosomal protein L12-B [Lucilia cuprina]
MRRTEKLSEFVRHEQNAPSYATELYLSNNNTSLKAAANNNEENQGSQNLKIEKCQRELRRRRKPETQTLDENACYYLNIDIGESLFIGLKPTMCSYGMPLCIAYWNYTTVSPTRLQTTFPNLDHLNAELHTKHPTTLAAPKADPNEVKVIYLRTRPVVEVGSSSALAPKTWSLGLSPKKIVSRVLPSLSSLDRPETSGHSRLVIAALKEPLGIRRGEEHFQAQCVTILLRNQSRSLENASKSFRQGVLWYCQGDSGTASVCWRSSSTGINNGTVEIPRE